MSASVKNEFVPCRMQSLMRCASTWKRKRICQKGRQPKKLQVKLLLQQAICAWNAEAQPCAKKAAKNAMRAAGPSAKLTFVMGRLVRVALYFLPGKKRGIMKIAFLIYEGFTALDVIGPYEVLSC